MSDIRDPEVTIASPVNGEVIDLADVPDPVFSSKAVKSDRSHVVL